ncbi:unnamed protein product [Meloidogyne enterolobii]|uniref:Uncharacterized protein n=1 Tax=Meloidogyne enterolobii TaxID=390850 RepID=A0ACB0XWI2_MELEN
MKKILIIVFLTVLISLINIVLSVPTEKDENRMSEISNSDVDLKEGLHERNKRWTCNRFTGDMFCGWPRCSCGGACYGVTCTCQRCGQHRPWSINDLGGLLRFRG